MSTTRSIRLRTVSGRARKRPEVQASAQRTQLPDGRVVHRVRVGPFAKPEDMNPMRARLSDAGFNASVSRNQ